MGLYVDIPALLSAGQRGTSHVAPTVQGFSHETESSGRVARALHLFIYDRLYSECYLCSDVMYGCGTWSLVLKELRRGVLRRMFGLSDGMGKLYNEELHNSFRCQVLLE
jgi:hypothetical protein